MTMKNHLLKLWKDEEGAELVEWVVIVALIAAAAVAVYSLLKDRLMDEMNEVLDEVTSN